MIKTVSAAVENLAKHFDCWSGCGIARDEEEAIDELIAAVRAEALAPATRGQSAELAKAEESMRCAAEFKGTREALVIAELDRLRARLAASESENAEFRKLCGRAAAVSKVCSRSANALRMAAEDGALKDEHVRGFMAGVSECLADPEMFAKAEEQIEAVELEAAARRAGK